MGLPSYIINFDELKTPIMEAIKEANINVTVGDVTLDSAEINISTKEIEDILDTFSVQLTNISDTNVLIKDISDQILGRMIAHDSSISGHMTQISAKITSILQETININSILEDIKEQLASEGTQEIHGHMLVIPAVAGTYTKVIQLTDDILFTGITISQSAWNNNDHWSLSTNSFTLMETVYTKMRGEHKQLSKYFPINSGNALTLTFNNSASGNSKYVWFDLEYININNIS